jgi:DNA-binding NarL/FixJ family response regulator
MSTNGRGRVIIVEDEAFTRMMVDRVLTADGWSVRATGTIADAMILLQGYQPNAIVCDLDFGSGPSGVDLLTHVAREQPWVGMVVLTAHAAPELAVPSSAQLPSDVVYLVKSAIKRPEEVTEAIDAAIEGRFLSRPEPGDLAATITLSPEQAEVLRLLAMAYSNQAIADARGTSVRAAEAMVQRVFQALGLANEPETNLRVQAARMWHTANITTSR